MLFSDLVSSQKPLESLARLALATKGVTVTHGTLTPNITGTCDLADIAAAHAEIDARRTTGILVVTFAD